MTNLSIGRGGRAIQISGHGIGITCLVVILAVKLVHTGVALRVLLQNLRHSHLEVLLSYVLSPFPQRVHPC